MKKHVFRYLLMTLTLLYILSSVLFVFKFDAGKDLVWHLVLSSLGMIGIFYLNLKYISGVLKLFTLVTFIHYYLGSLTGIVFCLAREDALTMDNINLGSLANTESFVLFFVLIYFLSGLSKKTSGILENSQG